MDYKPLELEAPLEGLLVQVPEGREDTVVIKGVSDLNLDPFRAVLEELQRLGLANVVLDLSAVPEASRGQYLAFLDGAVSVASGFEARYTGVTNEQLGFDNTWREYMAPKVAGSVDEAVASLDQ